MLGLRPLAAAVEAVIEHGRTRSRAPPHTGGVVLDVAHALDTACDDDVAGAQLHHHGCGRDRLEAAAAAPVQLHAGNMDRQPGLQRDPATDAGRLGIRIGLGEDNVIDQGRILQQGIAQGLDAQGRLLLRTDSGVQPIIVGEVSVRPQS